MTKLNKKDQNIRAEYLLIYEEFTKRHTKQKLSKLNSTHYVPKRFLFILESKPVT